MGNTIYPNETIIRLYDGTYVYIEEIQYSHDGLTHWENTFNPEKHISTIDNITLVDGHKYRRVRHAGDTTFQIPMKWIPDDGQSVLLRTTDTAIEWKLELENDWKFLISLSELKGDKGEQGVSGAGLNIDIAGALDLRPIFPQTNSTCTSCNNTSSTGKPILFMSIGNHKITSDDISDGLTYWHTFDGLTWYQTTNNDIDKYVLAWKATANNDANNDALTVNYQGTVLLFSTTPIYDSKGKIYILADNIWTELSSITTPTGYVKTSASDTLTYLEDKVDNITISINTTNKLQLNDNSIDYSKIKSGTFTDGFTYNISNSSIIFNPDDIKGYGLDTYISNTDGYKNFQIDLSSFTDDGLKLKQLPSIDGETNNKLIINVLDIIGNSDGLESYLDVDNYNNIRVKQGYGITIDTNGVNVSADELTINADGLTEIKVSETDNNSNGIQAKHLHKNTVNNNKGLQKGTNVTDPIEVKIDTILNTLGFNSNGELSIPDNAILGRLLNNNVADNNYGIKVINDALHIIIDTNKLEFTSIGEISLKDTYILSLLNNNVITSLNTLKGDVAFTGIPTPYINHTISTTGQNITIQSILDTSKLLVDVINPAILGHNYNKPVYDNNKIILTAGNGIILTPNDTSNTIEISSSISLPSAGSVSALDGTISDGVLNSFARADHKHSISDGALTIAKTNGLQALLDIKIEKDKKVGNMEITSSGIYLYSGNSKYLLGVNSYGELTTTLIV